MTAVASTTLAVALGAFLVGRAVLPLVLARRAHVPAGVLALEILVGNVVISLVALLLAECGVFTLVALLAASALVVLAAVAIRRVRGDLAAPAHGRNDLIGIGLVLAAYLWAFPPFDTALFGSDASLYLTAGVHVAEHGSLVVDDPTVGLLAPDARPRWFPSYRPGAATPPFVRVGGGLLLGDRQDGRVLPAFQPLLSVWAAIFYTLGGDEALAGPITYFGALFLGTVAVFVCELAGAWTAVVALGLLTSLVPQYWYSRFPMPEIPSQYFLWSGLWAATLSAAGRGRLGVVAGLAIGVAGLMRLDMVIHVAAGLALWTAVAPSAWRPAGPGFLPALAVTSAYAGIHQLLFPTHYGLEIAPRVQVVVDTLARLHLLDRRIGMAVLVVVVALAVGLARRMPADRARLLRATVRLIAAAGFASYAFALVATARPDFATNLRWLELYVGWPLIAVALVGVWCWWRDAPQPGARFTLVLSVVAVAQLFFYPPVSPQPLWAIRRMLRIALPFIAIAAALALTRVARRWQALAAVGAIALLSFGPRLAFGYRAPAYEHAMTYVRTLGALLPRGAVVLGDAAFLLESQLHTALWMTRDTPAYFVAGSDVTALRELRSAFHDRPTFWIGPASRAPRSSPGLAVTPVATYDFKVATRRMEPRDERDDLGLRAISLAVYRLE